MQNGYQDPNQAQNYSEFLNSADGETQKRVVLDIVLNSLKDAQAGAKILDLGCGPGWLSYELTQQGYKVEGCDAAKAQIDLAKKNHPDINFQLADPQIKLPYADNEFDVVVAILVICDMKDQPAALKEISRVLKPGGKLINMIPNPYYTLPVMQWKRGFWGRLFGKNPAPKLSPYFHIPHNGREFKWRGNLTRRFYTLAEEINHLLNAGFKIIGYIEPKCETTTKSFSRQYQLNRFPLYLVIELQNY
jgi:ubiquinone/menaquinone biosynthesis C-methylase UbiE